MFELGEIVPDIKAGHLAHLFSSQQMYSGIIVHVTTLPPVQFLFLKPLPPDVICVNNRYETDTVSVDRDSI